MWELAGTGLRRFAELHEALLIVPWWGVLAALATFQVAGWAVDIARGWPAEALRRRRMLQRLRANLGAGITANQGLRADLEIRRLRAHADQYFRSLPVERVADAPGIGAGTVANLHAAGFHTFGHLIGGDLRRAWRVGPQRSWLVLQHLDRVWAQLQSRVAADPRSIPRDPSVDAAFDVALTRLLERTRQMNHDLESVGPHLEPVLRELEETMAKKTLGERFSADLHSRLGGARSGRAAAVLALTAATVLLLAAVPWLLVLVHPDLTSAAAMLSAISAYVLVIALALGHGPPADGWCAGAFVRRTPRGSSISASSFRPRASRCGAGSHPPTCTSRSLLFSAPTRSAAETAPASSSCLPGSYRL